MIYDRKLSTTIAKEKSQVRNGKTRWDNKRKKWHKRKKGADDPRSVICINCPNMGNQFRCFRCPLYKAPDGSFIVIK